MASHTQHMNHPQPGSILKKEPIRNAKDIKLIKCHLAATSQRDSTLFTFGINTNLRASDLLTIQVGQVKYLRPGDDFSIREIKTKKLRSITMNNTVHEEVQKLLKTMPDSRSKDADYLFQSRKTGTALCVSAFCRIVKKWCNDANLRGSFGTHSLRKTWGYTHRTKFGTDIPTLMTIYNHSSQRQTLEYLCIQASEVKGAYLHEI